MNTKEKLPPIHCDGKFQLRHLKKICHEELQNMEPTERSRYLAYQPPVSPGAVKKCKKRLQNWKRLEEKRNQLPEIAVKEVENNKAVAQYKCHKKILYNINLQKKECELQNLVAAQSSAIQGIRLKAFLLPIVKPINVMILLTNNNEGE